jgi:hypothetical protein
VSGGFSLTVDIISCVVLLFQPLHEILSSVTAKEMSFPPPPPGLDLTEDLSGNVIGSVVALMAIATVAVGLRIASRVSSKAGFGWDDWLIFLSLVLESGFGARRQLAWSC